MVDKTFCDRCDKEEEECSHFYIDNPENDEDIDYHLCDACYHKFIKFMEVKK